MIVLESISDDRRWGGVMFCHQYSEAKKEMQETALWCVI
jgi:hypothetical protein